MQIKNFNEYDGCKWYVGHHKYINDIPIQAISVSRAIMLFETYIREECSDNTYTSDITGVEEIPEYKAKELNYFYITE